MADNKSFESTLHDIVYSIDAGTGLKIIRVALYILILLVVVMVYTATQFRGLKNEEAMDYCQLGRNVSLSDGLVTKNVRPYSMRKLMDRSADENPFIKSHPDLYHPPAYPVALSAGFSLFELFGLKPFEMPEDKRANVMPAEQWIVLPLNHIFTILTGWLLFCVGKRMFSREIGLLGMTIYFLSDVAWADSISGLNISMAVFFSVAAFHSMIVAMLNKRDGATKAKWLTPFLISVVLAAVAFLTRYITFAIVPGICLFAWLMCGRFRGGTRFVLIYGALYLALISPWFLRNHQVSGNIMGLAGHSALAESPLSPDNSLERDYDFDIGDASVSAALKAKWNLNYSGERGAVIPAMGGGVLMAFFIVTFFYHFVRPQVNHLRWGLGLSMLLMAGVAGFFSGSSMQMLHMFWPFAILYGLAFLYILIDRLDLGVRLYDLGIKGVIVALAALPLVFKFFPPHDNHPYPPYYAPMIANVAGMLDEDEVLCSDMSWATAWYGDRVSILLPKDLDQYYDIHDYKQYISGLYFTTITKNRPYVRELQTGSEESWFPLVMGQLPKDFPLKEGIALHGQEQLFLSDMNRWSEDSAARPAE